MIGANVSAAGGLANAFIQAEEWDLESCQFYVKPSRSWKGEMISDKVAGVFKERRKGSSVKSILGHSALIHNLAGAEEVRKKSMEGVRLELAITSALEIEQVVVHSGYGSIETLKKSLDEVLADYRGSTRLLLEVSAGQKGSRGANVEELVSIMEEFKSEKLGICLDTCHLFAAGFDVSNEKVFKNVLNGIGKKLGAIHLNDSKGDLGSHLDRHEHIGQGKIGMDGFRKIIKLMRDIRVPKVLETPERDEMTGDNLRVIRQLMV